MRDALGSIWAALFMAVGAVASFLTASWEIVSNIWSWFAGDLFSNLVSLAALVLASRVYLTGRPRLRISIGTAGLVIGHDHRMVLLVTATNIGGAPVRIRDVRVLAERENLFQDSSQASGPKLPIELGAHGDQAVWRFDFSDLRRRVEAMEPEEAVRFFGAVYVGTRRFRSPEVVDYPQVAARRRPLWPMRYRIAGSIRQLRRPQLHLLNAATNIDQANGTYNMVVINTGNGFGKGSIRFGYLNEFSDFKLDRIVEPVPTGLIRPKGKRSVKVPIVNLDPGVGVTQAHWRLTTRNASSNAYVEAITVHNHEGVD